MTLSIISILSAIGVPPPKVKSKSSLQWNSVYATFTFNFRSYQRAITRRLHLCGVGATSEPSLDRLFLCDGTDHRGCFPRDGSLAGLAASSIKRRKRFDASSDQGISILFLPVSPNCQYQAQSRLVGSLSLLLTMFIAEQDFLGICLQSGPLGHQ